MTLRLLVDDRYSELSEIYDFLSLPRMSDDEVTKVLLKRRDHHQQTITRNVDCEAPGPRQSAYLTCDQLIDGLVDDLEKFIEDDTIVDSVAMTADWVVIVINDPRGLWGSVTLSHMAEAEKDGHHTYTGRNREILDKCDANPEMFNQLKSGKS